MTRFPCGTMFPATAGDEQYVAYGETIDGGEPVVDCEATSTTPVDHVVVEASGIGNLIERVEAYLADDVAEPGETYHYAYAEYDADEHILGLFSNGIVIQGPPAIEYTCIECGYRVERQTDAFGLGNFNLLVHDACGESFVDSLRTLRDRFRRADDG